MSLQVALGTILNANNGSNGMVMADSCGSGLNCISASADGKCQILIIQVGSADSNSTLLVSTKVTDAALGGGLVAHGLDVTVGAANPTSKNDPEGSEPLVGHLEIDKGEVLTHLVDSMTGVNPVDCKGNAASSSGHNKCEVSIQGQCGGTSVCVRGDNVVCIGPALLGLGVTELGCADLPASGWATNSMGSGCVLILVDLVSPSLNGDACCHDDMADIHNPVLANHTQILQECPLAILSVSHEAKLGSIVHVKGNPANLCAAIQSVLILAGNCAPCPMSDNNLPSIVVVKIVSNGSGLIMVHLTLMLSFRVIGIHIDADIDGDGSPEIAIGAPNKCSSDAGLCALLPNPLGPQTQSGSKGDSDPTNGGPDAHHQHGNINGSNLSSGDISSACTQQGSSSNVVGIGRVDLLGGRALANTPGQGMTLVVVVNPTKICTNLLQDHEQQHGGPSTNGDMVNQPLSFVGLTGPVAGPEHCVEEPVPNFSQDSVMGNSMGPNVSLLAVGCPDAHEGHVEASALSSKDSLSAKLSDSESVGCMLDHIGQFKVAQIHKAVGLRKAHDDSTSCVLPNCVTCVLLTGESHVLQSNGPLIVIDLRLVCVVLNVVACQVRTNLGALVSAAGSSNVNQQIQISLGGNLSSCLEEGEISISGVAHILLRTLGSLPISDPHNTKAIDVTDIPGGGIVNSTNARHGLSANGNFNLLHRKVTACSVNGLTDHAALINQNAVLCESEGSDPGAIHKILSEDSGSLDRGISLACLSHINIRSHMTKLDDTLVLAKRVDKPGNCRCGPGANLALCYKSCIVVNRCPNNAGANSARSYSDDAADDNFVSWPIAECTGVKNHADSLVDRDANDNSVPMGGACNSIQEVHLTSGGNVLLLNSGHLVAHDATGWMPPSNVCSCHQLRCFCCPGGGEIWP